MLEVHLLDRQRHLSDNLVIEGVTTTYHHKNSAITKKPRHLLVDIANFVNRPVGGI